VIAITRSGYIKRLPVTAYREQRRGGIGVMGMDLKDADYIEHLFVASTHDYVLFFTTVGKVYRLKVHELPLGSRQSKGRAIVNLLPFRQDESVRAVIATRDYKEAKYLVCGTKKGVVKKTDFLAYNTPLKADGIIAIKMREDDELIDVRHSSGSDDILMVSKSAMTARFPEGEVRATGRATEGVRGMALREDDEVLAFDIAKDDAELLVVTEFGFGKRTPIHEYRRTRRGALGVGTIKAPPGRGKLAGALVVRPGQHVMLMSDLGTVIRTPVDQIRSSGRLTQGVAIMSTREGERVSAFARVVESDASDAAVAVAADAAVEAGIEPLDEPDFDEDGFPSASDEPTGAG
jgi:DNA gyrase subunit A